MKVCVDDGHGGYDPGACGNGLQEKDITLKVVLELKPLLEYNGIEVVLTRDGDYAPGHLEGDLNGELWARVNIAKQNNVDLFVSVHVNAGGGTGEEILISGTGGRAEVAAKKVLPYLVQAGGWANRGVKTQNVLVLRETSMPAILTENGFIDNPTDAAKLKDPNFIHALAVAHAKGICDYFGIAYKEPTASAPSPAPQPKPNVMYRVILDGKQVEALSDQGKAEQEVKSAVDSSKAQKGVVQRNTDGVNVFEYTKPATAPPPQVPQTSILGSETVTVEQCQQYIARQNPNAPDVVPFYQKYGMLLGIKWGFALAQAIKETGFFRFGGDVRTEQNNYAGIGAVGEGAQGASFATPEQGVLAHLEHLFAYASTQPLPSGLPKIDPRFDLIQRGNCPTWESLDGHWAVPGNGYGEDIIRIHDEIAKEVITPQVPANQGDNINHAVDLLKKALSILEGGN